MSTKPASIHDYSEDYADYMRDESRSVGTAESISFPKTEEEIVEILKYLYPTKTPVTIQGSRTGLAAAAVPHGGHAMNISKMTNILGMRKDENGTYYITVQPGLLLSDLKKLLAQKQFPEYVSEWSEESKAALADFMDADEQFFPTDPTETSACIGGIVACNSSGARSYHYGPARPHVSRVRIALCDGSVADIKRGETFADGRHMDFPLIDGRTLSLELPTYQMPNTKNASGYYAADNMDAIDVLIGSDGTFGVFTEIELILSPLPACIWAISSFFNTEADSLKYVAAAREASDKIAALEFFDEGALNMLRYQKANDSSFSSLPEIPEGKTTCVYTEMHCDDEDEAMELLETLCGILEEYGVGEEDTWVADGPAEQEKLRFFRHAVPESTNMRIDEKRRTNPAITKLGSDMSVPNDKLEEVVAMYRAGLAKYHLNSAIWGHIGNNHLHVNVIPENMDEYQTTYKMFREEWAPAVTKMGGAVSAEHGVGKLKSSFLATMYGPEHIKEMAALKKTFDPAYMFGRDNLFPAADNE